MNDQQKQLVQTSFQAVEPIADVAAKLFYDRLFTLEPRLRPLFKGDMSEQGRKLMTTLKFAVTSLNDLDKIIPALQHLGRSHVQYGVQEAHYAIVGEALIWTLAQGLGKQFTAEVEAAWLAAYGLLSGVMMAAAQPEAV